MQGNSHLTLSPNHQFRRPVSPRCCFGTIQCVLVIVALLCAAPMSFAVAPVPAAVPFHFVRGFAVVVPVTVNGHGPYDFMLDTGSTVTTVDRELGRELALETKGQGTFMTLTEQAPAPLAIAEQVVLGPLAEQKVVVMIRDLSGLHQLCPTARGVLGQNSLNHADFMLDYKHKLIEFDMDGELARSLGGHHVPLHREALGSNEQYANLSVHGSVNDNGQREMDFMLDSGSASMVLFGGIESSGTGYQESFVADTAGRHLPAGVRDLQLVLDGKCHEVATHVLAMKVASPRIGGLLPTSIFDRVYISNRGGFVMFDPKQKKPAPLKGVIAELPPQSAPHGGGF